MPHTELPAEDVFIKQLFVTSDGRREIVASVRCAEQGRRDTSIWENMPLNTTKLVINILIMHELIKIFYGFRQFFVLSVFNILIRSGDGTL